MDAIISTRNNLCIHSMPKIEMRPVHRNCGLWIFRSSNGGYSHQQAVVRPDRLLRYFEFYAISHMYDGKGLCYFPDGRKIELTPGKCVMISPHTVHLYGAAENASYWEDTINFCGPLADMLFRSGLIFNGVAELGRSRRLRPIIDLAADPSDNAQLNAAFALQKMLYELYNRRFLQHSHDRYQRIDALLETLKDSPEKWWSLSDMAEFCNIGIHQFRRLFQERVGLLPKMYLDKLRMNHAADLLAGDKFPITEIAARCGYSDPFHFSRRFKAVMGVSPQHYRDEVRKI